MPHYPQQNSSVLLNLHPSPHGVWQPTARHTRSQDGLRAPGFPAAYSLLSSAQFKNNTQEKDMHRSWRGIVKADTNTNREVT